MKELTTTSYAILGLLALRPWTAYELSQQMQRNMGEFWPRAARGIYNEPKNLVAHGYASASEERQGRRPRCVYAITRSGRRALRAWLGQPSAPPQLESESLLRLAFAEHGDLRDALRTLEELRQQVDERRRVITDVARDYVEGRGPYPDRIEVIAIVMRFFADYYAVLDDWALWGQHQLAAWEADGDDRALRAKAVLAEIAALRPA